MSYVFAFREKDTDNRDAVAYIDTANGRLCGCCYYGNSFFKDTPYTDVETVLSEAQYTALVTGTFEDCGASCSKEDIIKTLTSAEAKIFENAIKENEINIICDEWNIDRDDCVDMIEEYQDRNYTNYFDRGMIGCVYNNAEEIASEVLSNYEYFANLPNWLESYIDMEGIGYMLINNNKNYYELADGRVVSFNF